ncbi:MAG TPA: patatin [Thermoanaerobaculia bacterium]|jgi:hypothetical protein
MKRKDWLYWILVLISASTVLSGLVQVVSPGFVLHVVGGATDAAGEHFFRIVGMFMVLFGGMLLQALISDADHPLAVLWSAFQKLGAAGAVGIGFSRGFFASTSLLVAGFDLLTGILILVYWRSIRQGGR